MSLVNQSRPSSPIRIDTPIQRVARGIVAAGITISVVSAVRARWQYHQLVSMARRAAQIQRFAPLELARDCDNVMADCLVAVKAVETETKLLVKGGMALVVVGLLTYYSVDHWERRQSK